MMETALLFRFLKLAQSIGNSLVEGLALGLVDEGKVRALTKHRGGEEVGKARRLGVDDHIVGAIGENHIQHLGGFHILDVALRQHSAAKERLDAHRGQKDIGLRLISE